MTQLNNKTNEFSQELSKYGNLYELDGHLVFVNTSKLFPAKLEEKLQSLLNQGK